MPPDPHEPVHRPLFRAVFDRALDAMFLVDDDGRFVDANPAACGLLGYARDELLAVDLATVLADDVDPRPRWQHFLAAGSESGEVALRHSNGWRIDTEYRATANVVPGVHLSIHRDLTPGLRAQQALHNARVWASEILESLDDGYIALDDHWRFAYLNAAAERIFGHSREQLLGEVIWKVFPEAVGTEFHEQYEQVMQSGRPVTFEAYFRAPFDTWYREQVHPAGGGIAIFSRDVGEQRRMEERLHQDDKLRAVGEFAGGIAHDFNNLLTGISGFAELGRDVSASGEDTSGYLTEIERLAGQASTLVAELLAFSRRQARNPETLTLAEVTAGLERMLDRLISETVRVEVDVPDTLPAVYADRSQLEQVVVNLALNAQDAMPDGGTLTIRARSGPDDDLDDGWVELSVADTGTGMDAETRERMFEPFFTTKGRGHGSGLGLPSVHGAVTAADGHLVVESVPGEGTAVSVRLPVAAAGVDEPLAKPPPAAGGDRTGTVLLVEDEEAVRAVARDALEHAGHRVQAVADGGEALAVAERQEQAVDLLITDVVLPAVSGTELAAALRGRWPDLPVLLMSGYTAARVSEADLEGERTELLQKPFGLRELLEAVARLLAG